jgi:hypothetical protein
MTCLLDWFTKYEAVAVWLEGIALVLIFVWDRIEAGQQHEQTLKQLRAAEDQVEATHRPFVSFSTIPRAVEDAVLEVGGAVGALEMLFDRGNARIENIGSGPALNIRYYIKAINAPGMPARPRGYLVGVEAGEWFPTPIARETLRGNDWEIVITYESISGRKYQTKITISNLVMTDIQVLQLP